MFLVIKIIYVVITRYKTCHNKIYSSLKPKCYCLSIQRYFAGCLTSGRNRVATQVFNCQAQEINSGKISHDEQCSLFNKIQNSFKQERFFLQQETCFIVFCLNEKTCHFNEFCINVSLCNDFGIKISCLHLIVTRIFLVIVRYSS